MKCKSNFKATFVRYTANNCILIQLSTTVGQQATGMAFSIQAETDEDFVDLKAMLQNFEPYDALSRASYYWARSSMNYENVTLSYNPDISTATTVKITAAYGKILIHFYPQYLSLLTFSVSQFTDILSISVYYFQYLRLLLFSVWVYSVSVSKCTAALSISVYWHSQYLSLLTFSVSQFTAIFSTSVYCCSQYLSLLSLSISVYCCSQYLSSLPYSVSNFVFTLRNTDNRILILL